jgi:sugar lactone lactonase YvrE
MVRLEPLQRLGAGPEAEAALDLMTLLTTLDVLKPEPLRAPVSEVFRSPDGAARSVVSMTHDASGALHLLADGGKKLLTLGPTGAIENETALRDARFLFEDVNGSVAWASADTLYLSSGTVNPTTDSGPAPKPLRDMAQVAAAPDGSFYILEGKGTEVHHVAGNGSPLGVVARPGRGVALALDRQGWIYVLDAKNRKLLRLGPGGEDHGSLDLTRGDDRVQLPTSLAVDDAFHAYVLDEKTGEVWIFGATGKLLTRLRPDPDETDPVRDPSGMTVSPSGSVVLYDAKARAVRSFR